MTNLILLIILSINSILFGMQEKNDLINKYRKELLKIVKPGIESIISGSEIKFKSLGYFNHRSKAAISNDGKWLVVVDGLLDNENKIYIYNLEDLEEKPIILDNPDGKVTAVAISDCNNYLAVGLETTRSIKLWNISEKKVVKHFQLDHYVSRVQILDIALDKKLRYIVINTEIAWARKVSILGIDFNSEKEYINSDKFNCTYTNFALSNSGNFLLVGNGDANGEVTFVDTRNFPKLAYKKLGQLHLKKIDSIAVSACDRFAITSSDDTVKIWDLAALANQLSQKQGALPVNDDKVNNNPKTDVPASLLSYLMNYIYPQKASPKQSASAVNFELESNLSRQLVHKFKQFPEWYYSSCIREMSIAYKCGLATNFYPSAGSVFIFFDFSDLNNILTRSVNHNLCNVRLSKDGRYLIGFANNQHNQNCRFARLTNWAICDLDIDQLRALVKLINTDEADKIIKYFESIKSKFNQNLQWYIERYLRSKLLNIYYSEIMHNKMQNVEDIMGDYLGVEADYAQIWAHSKIKPMPELIRDSFKRRQIRKRVRQKTYNFNCAVCGKESMTRCGNCRLVYYCSKECQLAHWPEHKLRCKRSIK